MAQVINTNVQSINSQRQLTKSQTSLNTALQRLSSGLRINAAMDDAAGLAVTMKMDAQLRGMTVAVRNASDGISFSQTADTAMEVVNDQLQRMRELATQSLNGTLSNTERTKIDVEYGQLQTEITRIQGAAKLNGMDVLTGSDFSFQVGADAGQSINATFTSVDVSGTSVSTTAGASVALASIDKWLGSVATERANIGGVQSRLNFTISYLEGAIENQSAAKSRILDADFAAETAALTRGQILQQSGVAMVSQANSIPQNVLSLLR
ncbi:MAG: flagellin FliC [Candidatus Accumulibacter sp.]|jgi:flagellin|nr:flagellin FliC [Accumulibacter sp.]